MIQRHRPTLLASTVALVLLASFGTAGAQSTAAKPAARQASPAASKPPAKAKAAPRTAAKTKRGAKTAASAAAPEPVLAAAPPEQVSAAEGVYYGVYECEFNQTIRIASSPKHFGYVDLRHGKADYLMKPVLSSTGAIRLEDVTGGTLMVQIASKSMLLNVRTAQRIVDDCVSPKQRELIEAARAAKAAAVVAAAASAADAASPADAASAASAASGTATPAGAVATEAAPVGASPASAPVEVKPAAATALPAKS